MRALIRTHTDGSTEVMTEPFSHWVEANLAFLTGAEKDEDGNLLKGDGWTLVEDYVEPTEDSDDSDLYVTINGQRVLKSKLQELLS